MELPGSNQRNPERERRLLGFLVLSLVLLLGGYLRFAAVAGTVVQLPYRGDAAGYYNLAYNLNTFHTFSKDIYADPRTGRALPPPPDAYRTPLYPLFLMPFVHTPPNPHVFNRVALWQALMGTAAVLLLFLLMRRLTGTLPALAAAAFAAISPHLVNVSMFMLTETLFGFLVLLSLLAFALHYRERRWFLPGLLLSGALVGLAALTRPILEFFPLALMLVLAVSYPRREALKGAAAVVLGFALVWSPWIARNYMSLGQANDSATMLETLAVGLYPDIEYNHDPASAGEPNRHDPRYAEIQTSVGSIAAEFIRRVRENPAEELGWYFVGKPVRMWSWEMTDDGGDAFIYPVAISPYTSSPVFMLTRGLMYSLHWVLVLLALAGCILVWLPAARRDLAPGPLMLARLLCTLLVYVTLVLIIMTPSVRYTLPFLPEQYGMAALGAWLGLRQITRRRAAGRKTA